MPNERRYLLLSKANINEYPLMQAFIDNRKPYVPRPDDALDDYEPVLMNPTDHTVRDGIDALGIVITWLDDPKDGTAPVRVDEADANHGVIGLWDVLDSELFPLIYAAKQQGSTRSVSMTHKFLSTYLTTGVCPAL